MPTTFDVESHDLRDRPAALAEGLARLPVALDVSAVGPMGEYGFTTATEYFGRIFLASCRGWGAEVHRDHRRVAHDHERTLLLSLATSGTAEYRQEATTIRLAAGGLVQYCSTIPFAATLNNVARHTLMIPYTAVDLPDHLIEARAGQLVDTTTPLGRIVVRYLRDLGAHGIYLPPADRLALEKPTLDLLRALLSTNSAPTARARDPLHATLGIRMQDYLRVHLREPDLNIGRVATAHGISERYAYLVLAQQGISLGDWLRSERLRGAARELLASPDATIATVSAMWAFPDHANFTRAFRRAVGMSPREYRVRNTTDSGLVAPTAG